MSHRRRIVRSVPAKKDWRKGESPIVMHPCQHALMLAIQDKDFSTADKISRRAMRKVYGSLPKPQPQLVGLLSRMVGRPL